MAGSNRVLHKPQMDLSQFGRASPLSAGVTQTATRPLNAAYSSDSEAMKQAGGWNESPYLSDGHVGKRDEVDAGIRRPKNINNNNDTHIHRDDVDAGIRRPKNINNNNDTNTHRDRDDVDAGIRRPNNTTNNNDDGWVIQSNAIPKEKSKYKDRRKDGRKRFQTVSSSEPMKLESSPTRTSKRHTAAGDLITSVSFETITFIVFICSINYNCMF